jgi:hypothetical protein
MRKLAVVEHDAGATAGSFVVRPELRRAERLTELGERGLEGGPGLAVGGFGRLLCVVEREQDFLRHQLARRPFEPACYVQDLELGSGIWTPHREVPRQAGPCAVDALVVRHPGLHFTAVQSNM